MFTTEHVQFTIQKAALSFERDDDGNEKRVADLTLVIEPLPYALAAELGCAILDHLFTADEQIRPELGKVTFTVQPKEKHGQQWLKAQVTLTIDLAEKQIREFLFFHFGTIRLFSFFPEQGDMWKDTPGLSGMTPREIANATSEVSDGRTERKAH